ncbi:hypothetical protein ACOSQ3_004900 [Xanthoceras sorbifolium]
MIRKRRKLTNSLPKTVVFSSIINAIARYISFSNPMSSLMNHWDMVNGSDGLSHLMGKSTKTRFKPSLQLSYGRPKGLHAALIVASVVITAIVVVGET